MQHNGGDLENMTAKLLEKHITDTIREWQVKIGYEGGTMKLYYPAESLRRSLSLDETEDLDAALAAFCTAASWNTCDFSGQGPLLRGNPGGGMFLYRAENPCSGAPAEPSAGDHNAWKHNGTGSKLLFFLCRENAYYRGRKRIRGA